MAVARVCRRSVEVRAMRRRGEQGQTGIEMAGMLLLVSLVVGALAAGGVPAAIADHTASAVCRIAGGDCTPVAPAAPTDPDGPDQGPVLIDGPVLVLPFPGSVTVSCTYSEQSRIDCLDPEEPGVGIAATARHPTHSTRRRSPPGRASSCRRSSTPGWASTRTTTRCRPSSTTTRAGASVPA